ncbi:MAG: hypothetical protein ACP5E5_13515 [Acidobacteriaceae bacterium]
MVYGVCVGEGCAFAQEFQKVIGQFDLAVLSVLCGQSAQGSLNLAGEMTRQVVGTVSFFELIE